MKSGAEVGGKTELALIFRRLCAEPVGSSETGANAIRAVSAGANPPSGDHLVTDIFVDFAAGFCDRERYIDDEAVEGLTKRSSPRRSAVPVEERISMNRSARSSMLGS